MRRGTKDLFRRGFLLVLVGTALFLLAVTASASLLGDTVDCTATGGLPGWDCFPTSATVISPGAEFNLRQLGIGNELQLDVDSDTVTISLGSSIAGIEFGPIAGLGFTLSDLDDSNGPLLGFSLALFGNVLGFNTSAISLSGDSVSVLFDGISFDFPHNPDITDPPRAVITFITSAAPEPSTLALLALAVMVLAWFRWR
jgi:hypothetical protein